MTDKKDMGDFDKEVQKPDIFSTARNASHIERVGTV